MTILLCIDQLPFDLRGHFRRFRTNTQSNRLFRDEIIIDDKGKNDLCGYKRNIFVYFIISSVFLSHLSLPLLSGSIEIIILLFSSHHRHHLSPSFLPFPPSIKRMSSDSCDTVLTPSLHEA